MSQALEWQFSIDVANTLGECIQWHAASATLWWTDIENSRLYRYDWAARRLDDWSTPDRLTAYGLLAAEPPELVASFASGFARYRPGMDAEPQWLARPEAGLAGNRFNDGRVDRQGRFWSGTMNEANKRDPSGRLYRLDEGGSTAVLDGLVIPNALSWSPDGRLMYHADTPSGTIRVHDFDPASGAVGPGRLFARVPKGYPDGAAVDAEGRLWVALWGGSAVACYRPDGTLDALHDLPVSQPSCVAFGGPDLDQLCITTAREELTAEQLEREPLAGSVLVYGTSARGLEEMTPDPARLPKALSAAR